MSAALVKHTGGCHCGKVRFEVIAKPELNVYDCNCSICVKKGMHLFLVPKEYFKIVQGEENITCYMYNTHKAKHYFCKTCGVQPFYTPRTNPNGAGVSLQCLDEGTVSRVNMIKSDAKNWEIYEKYLDENPKARSCTDNVE